MELNYIELVVFYSWDNRCRMLFLCPTCSKADVGSTVDCSNRIPYGGVLAGAAPNLFLGFNIKGSHDLFIFGRMTDCFLGVVSQDSCVEGSVKTL